MDKEKKQQQQKQSQELFQLPLDAIDPEIHLFKRNKKAQSEMIEFLEGLELNNLRSPPGIYIAEMLCYLMADDFYNTNHCLKRALDGQQVKQFKQIYIQIFKIGSLMYNHQDRAIIPFAKTVFTQLSQNSNNMMIKLFQEFIRYNQVRYAIFLITGYERFSEESIVSCMDLENFEIFIKFCQEFLPNFNKDIFQKEDKVEKSKPYHWIHVNRSKAQVFLNQYSPSIVLPSLQNLQKMKEIIKFIESDSKAIVEVTNRASFEQKMIGGGGGGGIRGGDLRDQQYQAMLQMIPQKNIM